MQEAYQGRFLLIPNTLFIVVGTTGPCQSCALQTVQLITVCNLRAGTQNVRGLAYPDTCTVQVSTHRHVTITNVWTSKNL